MDASDTAFIQTCIVEELNLPPESVQRTTTMLREGSTVHFIARYRKEQSGGLDEIQIRHISERLDYFTQLQERKQTILHTIKQQGKLTEELAQTVRECREKQRLEDLYLPYKPKKKTRATVAKEKGLEPLAERILLQSENRGDKEKIVAEFVNPAKGVNHYNEAIGGAIDIVAEKIADTADIRDVLRKYFLAKGMLTVKAQREWAGQKTKFVDYYDYTEAVKDIPSHRLLAIRRGSKEKVLTWKIEVDEVFVLKLLESKVIHNPDALFDHELRAAIRESYRRLLSLSIEMDVFLMRLAEAEKEAIKVFSRNLENLLLFPPAGQKVILGIDPGFMTGCKAVVIDGHGNFKEYRHMFPTPPRNEYASSARTLVDLLRRYKVEVIAIGNGTASRETTTFVRKALAEAGLDIVVLVVNESGASVYSASQTAIDEFPDEDVTVRGAISIARRVQDPLSELVKIDPKSIGVGQYQHDVNQGELKKSLRFVVESCVNRVGVDLNTASVELLSYVSGVGPSTARNVVEYRSKVGGFSRKEQLLEVPRLGEKVFEQCAGFLRVYNGDNPLDNSAIHPERYALVGRMAKDMGMDVRELIGCEEAVRRIDFSRYVDKDVGMPTLRDIQAELIKPGVDPRKNFESIQFSPDVTGLEDLAVGMELEGTVTNVTNFGAFVDLGIHCEGLIHISKLSDRYVRDPHKVVAVGDIVKIVVISLDVERKRIGLKLLSKRS